METPEIIATVEAARQTTDTSARNEAFAKLLTHVGRLTKFYYVHRANYLDREIRHDITVDALFLAIDAFDPQLGNFKSIFKTILERRLNSAKARECHRRPKMPVLFSVLDKSRDDEEATYMKELIAELASDHNASANNEDTRIDNTYWRSQIVDLLSAKKWQIFRLFLDGYSYTEINSITGHSEKVVDNALCRVRQKITAKKSFMQRIRKECWLQRPN